MYIFSYVAQQRNSGLGRLIFEVSVSHTARHTQPVGLLWTSDKFVTEAASYAAHNKSKGRKLMPSARLDPVMASTVPRQR